MHGVGVFSRWRGARFEEWRGRNREIQVFCFSLSLLLGGANFVGGCLTCPDAVVDVFCNGDGGVERKGVGCPV